MQSLQYSNILDFHKKDLIIFKNIQTNKLIFFLHKSHSYLGFIYVWFFICIIFSPLQNKILIKSPFYMPQNNWLFFFVVFSNLSPQIVVRRLLMIYCVVWICSTSLFLKLQMILKYRELCITYNIPLPCRKCQTDIQW